MTMKPHPSQRETRHLVPAGVVLAGYLATVAACSTATPSVSNPVAPTTPSPAVAEVSLESMLTATIQDEFHAEATYARVLAEHGSVFPFVNIVRAEQRHSEAIARLFTSRGLQVPSSVWTVDNVPSFSSVQAACAAAVQAEIDNIALYDQYLALALPADVQTVFTSNRAASLNNHLPAFNACR
jgi:hypothetical protein